MKSVVVDAGRRRRKPRQPVELPNAVEGQVAEICRDLAVQVKRMRALQEQADELRVAVRDWASRAEPIPARERAIREERR